MPATSYAAARRILLGEGKKPAEIRRAYYVCDTESYLIEDFVDQVRRASGAGVADRVVVDAAKVDASEVWTQVAQYPSSAEAKRFVLVRHGEAITSWSWFEGWYSDRDTRTCVVFTQEGPPDVEAAHIVRLAKQGGLVRCRPLASRDAVYLIGSVCGATPVQAEHIFRRCGGDGAQAFDAAKKLRYLGTSVPEVVDRVIPPASDLGFVDLLIEGRKTEALQALEAGVELPLVLGRLNDRLERLSRLHRAMKRGEDTVFGLVKATGLSSAQVVLLRPHALAYGRERLERCSYLLWLADSQTQRGVGGVRGVEEMLVAMW